MYIHYIAKLRRWQHLTLKLLSANNLYEHQDQSVYIVERKSARTNKCVQTVCLGCWYISHFAFCSSSSIYAIMWYVVGFVVRMRSYIKRVRMKLSFICHVDCCVQCIRTNVNLLKQIIPTTSLQHEFFILMIRRRMRVER